MLPVLQERMRRNKLSTKIKNIMYLFENNQYRGQFENRNAAATNAMRITGDHLKYLKRPDDDNRTAYEFFLELQATTCSQFQIIDPEDWIIRFGKTIHPNQDPDFNSLFLSYEDACDFFSRFRRRRVDHAWPVGTGWSVADVDPLSNYEFTDLTRLVVMAHDKCFRVMVSNTPMNGLSVAIFKRNRSGDLAKRKFPTIEDAITQVRSEKFNF